MFITLTICCIQPKALLIFSFKSGGKNGIKSFEYFVIFIVLCKVADRAGRLHPDPALQNKFVSGCDLKEMKHLLIKIVGKSRNMKKNHYVFNKYWEQKIHRFVSGIQSNWIRIRNPVFL